MKEMRIAALVVIFTLTCGILSLGAAEERKRIAAVVDTNGKVEVRNQQGEWIAAKKGMVLQEGDVIRTNANSFAVLNVDGLAETATVEVKEKSQLKLIELIENKEKDTQNTFLDLALGEILIKAKKLHSEKSSFEVKTPTSVVGVRGTTFSIAVEAIE